MRKSIIPYAAVLLTIMGSYEASASNPGPEDNQQSVSQWKDYSDEEWAEQQAAMALPTRNEQVESLADVTTKYIKLRLEEYDRKLQEKRAAKDSAQAQEEEEKPPHKELEFHYDPGRRMYYYLDDEDLVPNEDLGTKK